MSPPLARSIVFLLSQYWLELATRPPHKGGDSTAAQHRSNGKVFSGLGFALFHHLFMNGIRMCLLTNSVCDVLLCWLSLLPTTTTTTPMLGLTPRIVAGAACIYVMYAVRTHCYKQLGHMFTFVVTIQPQHRIVKSGVYRYVRHASYPAAWVGCIGAVLLHAGPGSAFGVWAPKWLASVVMDSRVLWVLVIPLPAPLIYTRICKEERVMEEEFGDEWRQYRNETWAAVPFLY